jgi:hypothetical protein
MAMKRITITIETTNQAFNDSSKGKDEVVRILANAIGKLDTNREVSILRDINGNSVGNIIIE